MPKRAANPLFQGVDDDEFGRALGNILKREDYPIPHDDDAANVEVLEGEYVNDEDDESDLPRRARRRHC